jgi:ATP-dependent Clp protease ATP-binding subunit ClpC
MSNNFTPRAQQALALAKKEAESLKHNYIGTEHLLIGLIKIGQGLAASVLKEFDVELEDIYEIIEDLKENKDANKKSEFHSSPSMTPRVKKVLVLADKESKKMRHTYVGTEHILLGIIVEGDGIAAIALKKLGLEYDVIKEAILNKLDPDHTSKDLVPASEEKQQNQKFKKKNSSLATYGKDLTELAEKNELDVVVGREEEIDRAVQILCRRTKNNPILLGEAGVGKTAIAEGLAQLIVSKNVPDILLNKRVIALDLALLVAGTMYRGQFEERIKLIMSEIKTRGDVILFIDEIHTMVGAGAASGSMDASNIFKPALSRGELQLVGATTLNEYRKFIEKDAALERRFQQIKVDAPSIEQTIKILQGIRPKYEQHHKAKFLDSSLEAAAKLSERYICNRFLPDKAIDLMDEAGSRARMNARVSSPNFSELENSISELNKQKLIAISSQKFEEAANIRDQERKAQTLLKDAIQQWSKDKQEKEVIVGEDQIMEVLAKWTGIPLTKIEQNEASKLLTMEKVLSERIIGQDEAVASISKAMRRARTDLKDPRRPIGSFLFLGPTGVGKTFLTQSLAELMFGTRESIIQIDMSEYMEKFSVSRLIGPPPGYIGYEEGGQLTEAVRRKPYSVVLFDEIEKAHPDALHLLLQILEEGKVTDSLGRKVDFRNTIIIMTSNVGATMAKKQTSLGFGVKSEPSSDHESMKEKILLEAKTHFKPELINRLDNIIVFRSLEKPELVKIVDLEVQKITNKLKERGIDLVLSESAKDLLIEKGYDPTYGARPMRRAVEKYIEDPMAEEILKDTFKPGSTVSAEKDNDLLIFKKIKLKKQSTKK